MGVAAADYDNDGDVDLYLTGLGRQPPVPQPGRRPLRRRHRDGRRRRRRLLDERGFVRLRQGRPARPVRRATTWSGRSRRTSICTLDGKTKSYCTPESYKGQSPTLYRNRGDGTLRGRDAAGRPLRPGLEGARRRAPRLRRRRLARPVRRQRHAAEQALSQQRQRHASPTSAVTAGVAFSEAGVARAGMGVDAADYDGSGRPSLVIGNFSNEMMALYHNEGNGPLHRRGAHLRDRPGLAADADLRLLLLRLRPRRPARHLRRQRPRRRRHQRGAAEGQVRAAAAPVPQPRRAAASRR